MGSIFIELGVVFTLAALLAVLCKRAQQPIILAYVGAGILFAQFYTGTLTTDVFEGLMQVGIALLLFLVGLNMDIHVLKEVGKVSIVLGVCQMIVSTVFGYVVLALLGYQGITAIYLSVALAFSSTIIVIKLLIDKNDLEALYGKIAVGFLLVQDLIAILLLLVIAAGESGGLQSYLGFAFVAGKGMLLLILAMLIHHVFKQFFGYLGKPQELLFLLTIAWCFFMAMVASWFGFSLEMGSFIAGVTLASLPFKLNLNTKIRPLRDFFLIIFFVVLGMQLPFETITSMFIPAVILSLFVLISKPLFVVLIMGLLGYRMKTGFSTGIAVAQVSEFSLVIIALGVKLGHVDERISGLITLVGIITITISTYFMTFTDSLYKKCAPLLKFFERKKVYEQKLTLHAEKKQYDVLIVGYHRIGYNILERLQSKKMKFLVIDYNPLVIKHLMAKNIPCLYGDVSEDEVLEALKKFKPKMIISTIHPLQDNLLLTHFFKKVSKNIAVYATARNINDALMLYDHGANYVIIPHLMEGERVADLLKHTLKSRTELHKIKEKHIQHLLSIDLPKKV